MILNRYEIRLLVFVSMACLFCIPSNLQADGTQPYEVIATSAVKGLWEAKTNVLLIDTRNPEEYEDVHIPGAINIPQKAFDQHIDMLPREKTTRLIFYCNGFK